VLIGILLALRKFEGFEDFLHLIERFAQGFDNLVYVVDGILDCCRRGRMLWRWCWERRTNWLSFRCGFRLPARFGSGRLWIRRSLLGSLFWGFWRRFISF
jgi:hypothetical protein